MPSTMHMFFYMNPVSITKLYSKMHGFLMTMKERDLALSEMLQNYGKIYAIAPFYMN